MLNVCEGRHWIPSVLFGRQDAKFPRSLLVGDMAGLGTRNAPGSSNPHERVVAVPFLWPRQGAVLQEHGMGVIRPDERKAFVNTGRLPDTHRRSRARFLSRLAPRPDVLQISGLLAGDVKVATHPLGFPDVGDRKSTRLNSSH